jgi:branched-chain amino acid transport system substrate-binding protein
MRKVKMQSVMRWTKQCLLVMCFSVCSSAAANEANKTNAPPIRLAVIEGLSGAFANTGEAALRNLRFAVERINARGGVRTGSTRRLLELQYYDSKSQVEEALIMFKAAVQDEATFILQGNSSAVAAALIDAVNTHNERSPAARLLYLNYAAVDPALTNEKCSPWHFRFDAHAHMRMQALSEAMRQDAALKKVYLLNQDYTFGRSVARAAREQLAAKRPDVEVVGDELHPLGRIKDFSSYTTKIVASGAQAIVTGNWGNDLALLVKAAKDAGFQGMFYTFYGNALGTPAAIGDAGVGKVIAVAEWHYNAGEPAAQSQYDAFRQRYPNPADDYLNARMVTMIDMLAAAIEKAGSSDAALVAKALAGMQHPAAPHAVTMRAQDHQLIAPLYVFRMEKAGGAVKYDVEGSGYGFVTQLRLPAAQVALPSTCQMPKVSQ